MLNDNILYLELFIKLYPDNLLECIDIVNQFILNMPNSIQLWTMLAQLYVRNKE